MSGRREEKRRDLPPDAIFVLSCTVVSVPYNHRSRRSILDITSCKSVGAVSMAIADERERAREREIPKTHALAVTSLVPPTAYAENQSSDKRYPLVIPPMTMMNRLSAEWMKRELARECRETFHRRWQRWELQLVLTICSLPGTRSK